MPIRPEAEEFAAFLNELVEADRVFVQALVDHRIPCNETIADHPSVQVGLEDGQYRAGLLGVLNGFLGTLDSGPKAGWGALTALYESGHLVKFALTVQHEANAASQTT